MPFMSQDEFDKIVKGMGQPRPGKTDRELLLEQVGLVAATLGTRFGTYMRDRAEKK